MRNFLNHLGWLAAGIFMVSKTLDNLFAIYERTFGWRNCVKVGGCSTVIPEIFFSILGIAGFIYLVQNPDFYNTSGDSDE